jgi:hypothetical protein
MLKPQLTGAVAQTRPAALQHRQQIHPGCFLLEALKARAAETPAGRHDTGILKRARVTGPLAGHAPNNHPHLPPARCGVAGTSVLLGC